MLVSFCVIAYNEEKAIKSLFSDIKAQDYPHEKNRSNSGKCYVDR